VCAKIAALEIQSQVRKDGGVKVVRMGEGKASVPAFSRKRTVCPGWLQTSILLISAS
jgi:hypothetical protein